MTIPKKRRKRIMEFATQGGTSEIGPEIWDDDENWAKFKRALTRDTMRFLRTSTNPDELHLFARHWDWDGNVRPLFALIKNPHVDAGTLLMLYWMGPAEDYYLFYDTISTISDPFEREVFRLLRQIERKLVKGDYATASIKFDPTPRISMWDRRDEFARAIPDQLYRPTGGSVERKR